MHYETCGKRALDILLVALSAVVWVPVGFAVAGFIRVGLGSPVLFKQRRAGLRGRPFTILKFRTMRPEKGPDGSVMSDEERLGGFGRVLRALSLDEIPQLINVLKGEMSLVGPRPLLVSYLDRYSEEQARRHDVRPGVTGWAQVNGRNAITWEEKFCLDVHYVDNVSLALDLKILVLTVWNVLKRQGINQPGIATMEEFRGSGFVQRREEQ